MQVCVVGAGAREHALAAVLGRTAEVVVTPGNAGIPGSIDTAPEAVDADLFVIGPEVPLVDGLADRLRASGRLVFGPGSAGAALEGSKAFMKQVLVEAGVPTARFGTFRDSAPALDFLRSLPGPWVVKTSGLSAGKGVLVTTSLIEAEDDLRAKLGGHSFGEAGRTVVVEEGLAGPEVSVFAVCDGHRAVALSPARDHKRVGDGDSGPNTGGMGAFTPVRDLGDRFLDDIVATMIEPTLAVLRGRGIDFRGVLYAGLMLTADGPRMLEYNVRFGDPEAQVVLPGLTCDLTALLAGAAAGRLDTEPTWSSDALVTVVCAAAGYPGATRTGDLIEGMEDARSVEGVEVFCAGVDDGPRTAGGRVLAVTGRAGTLSGARERAYTGVARLHWPGLHYRTDIAAEAAGKDVAAP